VPDDLDALGRKIAAARGEPQSEPSADTENRRRGLQAGAELVGGILGGGLLGYGLDAWLGTTPGFLLGGLILGFATALYNIARLEAGVGTAVGRGLPPAEKPAMKGPDSQTRT